MKKVWVFYSYAYNSNIEVAQGEVTCKKPQLTKLWKKLANTFHTEQGMESIGYREKELS